MKLQLLLVLSCVALTLGAIRSGGRDNVCNPGEFCVHLCCQVNDPLEKCSNLSLIDESKLKADYKVMKGRPCKNMYLVDEEEETWEFLPVRL
jgi:hypothetical protein